ncbi:MAG TPA: hypothetical protein VGL20_17295 [Candidatus Dormibacteraeota bacterium]
MPLWAAQTPAAPVPAATARAASRAGWGSLHWLRRAEAVARAPTASRSPAATAAASASRVPGGSGGPAPARSWRATVSTVPPPSTTATQAVGAGPRCRSRPPWTWSTAHRPASGLVSLGSTAVARVIRRAGSSPHPAAAAVAQSTPATSTVLEPRPRPAGTSAPSRTRAPPLHPQASRARRSAARARGRSGSTRSPGSSTRTTSTVPARSTGSDTSTGPRRSTPWSSSPQVAGTRATADARSLTRARP